MMIIIGYLIRKLHFKELLIKINNQLSTILSSNMDKAFLHLIRYTTNTKDRHILIILYPLCYDAVLKNYAHYAQYYAQE